MMKVKNTLAQAILLAAIFFFAMVLLEKYARNTSRNRAIEKVLGDLGEYELESALAF